jgi:hypothetical protein
MNLTHTILEDGNLKIEADEATMAELKEMRFENPCAFTAERTLYDVFENLLGNSNLEWIDPSECGDLTDAPILGIRGDVYPVDDPNLSGPMVQGHWRDDEGNMQTWVRDVESRWGYMDYAVRNILDDLADKGCAIFQAPE